MSFALSSLRAESARIGKSEWRPMLSYLAGLHQRSIHPHQPPFSRPWEEIGPGYVYGPAFGHWDIVHQIIDVLPSEPEHARDQLLNDLENQEEDGLVPGSIWMPGPPSQRTEPRWSTSGGHPPVWHFAVQHWVDLTGDPELIRECYGPLLKQIGWFEKNRKADPEGFFYTDIITRQWESGVDEGVRFIDAPKQPLACVDATSHVYSMYERAAAWAGMLGEDDESSRLHRKAEVLADYVRNEMFSEETGFFHDIWSVGDPEKRVLTFEGMWPVVVGVASREQAERAIDENLLNAERFFTTHPITTVAVGDPGFELRCWRGPAWNSMTYWAARGCMNCNRPDAAAAILDAALDSTASQFDRTGTIWEFYHPLGGRQQDVQRKPSTKHNIPCRDYLGHNPLFAMARLWEQAKESAGQGDNKP